MKKLLFISLTLICSIGMVSCRTGWWEPIVLTTYNPEGDELGRYTFTYNKSGSCYTENGEVKDATTNNWVKNYRTSYGYDPFGVRISQLQKYMTPLVTFGNHQSNFTIHTLITGVCPLNHVRFGQTKTMIG